MHRLGSIATHDMPPLDTSRSRYSDWFVLLWSMVLCGALSLLGGCGEGFRPAATVPPVTASQQPSATATASQQQAFNVADMLRQRAQDEEALEAFKDFLRQHPSSPLTDQVLLALGDLSVQFGQPMQAEGYYRSLVQNFPASPHVAKAHLALGVLAYQLQDYDRGLVSLRQALPGLTAPEQQGKAQYYLGAIARQQQRYIDAIDALKIAIELSSDPDLQQQAQSDITAIIQDDSTLPDLQQMSERYPTDFPGGLILFRLAELYREDKAVIEEMATLQRFTTAFADHPDIPLAEARLQVLQSALSTNPTKIGVLLPLSGEGQLAGQRTLWGIELALSGLRARDPSLELTLVPRDSQGDSAVASEALRSLVSDEHVIAVIGPLFSQVATDIGPLVDALSIPTISPYARDSEFPLLSAYAFRNSLTDATQAQFLAEYAIQVLNLTRFAILYPDESYGTALKDVFIEHIIRLQGEVVAVASYPQDTTDFRQPIKQIGGVDDQTLNDLIVGADTATLQLSPDAERASEQAAKPYDAIFLPGYYDRVGLIAPELAFYNVTNVQLLGSDGWNAEEITAIGERFVEKALFVDGFFADSPAPAVSAFVQQFQQRYGERPALLAAQGYDTLLLLAQVLRTGLTTRDELRDSLLQVRNFPGLSGLTSFTPQGDTEKVPYLLTIRKGRIIQVN
ncbi:MAG: penicillin-binding protein activator [Candidatus Tectomicrobia bacterium]|nr:penicillin-binding protein activator [Candidatus Tectomicrobia bacterium]